MDLAYQALENIFMVLTISVFLFLIHVIFMSRVRGRVHWWHYPMIVLFFTASLTVPSLASL